MAEKEEVVTKGMFNKFMAWLNSEVKAEDIPEKEDDAAEEAKAMDEPKEEEPEAMEEKPDLEAENVALKAELEELKAKAMEDDEEVKAMEEKEKEDEDVKAMAIFNATVDNKITFGEAKNLLSKSLSFVNETLADKVTNATGLADSEVPQKEVVNHYETWKAMLQASDVEAQNYYKKHRDSISKEK